MPKFLLNLPLELQIEILNHLNLMDVCLFMQVPALEPCILARLPRDEIEISDFYQGYNEIANHLFPSSNEEYYPARNKINYYSRHLQIILKFLGKVKLLNPIQQLSIRYLGCEQVESLFYDYLGYWGNGIFKRVQISDYPDTFKRGFVNVPWCKLSILIKAYCLIENNRYINPLVPDLIISSSSSSLENQKMFLVFCFSEQIGISDSILDFSRCIYEAHTIMALVIKFRSCILNSRSPIQKAIKALVCKSGRNRDLSQFTPFQNLEKLSIEVERQPHLGKVIQKLVNLKVLKLVGEKLLTFRLNLKFPKLLKLTLINFSGEQNLSKLPRLEQLSVKQYTYTYVRIALQDISKSIKSLELKYSPYTMTQNSLFTKNRCYRSLVELKLWRISSLEHFSMLKESCPVLKKLKLGMCNAKSDSFDFASYLPQSINLLYLNGGGFEDTNFDFSGLANLQSLYIDRMRFSVSNVIWGTSITTLNITYVDRALKGNFIIGFGTLNQLQQLSLVYITSRSYGDTGFCLDFGSDSMLQILSIHFVDFPKDNLCKNLKYLEVLEDKGCHHFISAAFKDYSNLKSCIDFCYDDSMEYTGSKSFTGSGNLSAQDVLENYRKLKSAYGLQHDPLKFYVW